MKTLKSDEIYSCVESMVKEAERSVKISSAWLKGSIVDKLLSNLPDSVELEVILRASELQDLLITDDYVFRKIEEKGGQVYLNNRLHAKFILAAVETYVEFAGRDLIDLLPSLQTGMGILSGLGVPFPVVVEVDG
ncbi:hypothetical protein [Desulfurobacterium sp.]|uniref:hypothetical protein n=1 Tax=Desulfurobacterium sp. TaxID=2004706 RepID=UPI00261EECFA|nr:hypothetical protein [Desulfurobacterium sp.]